MLNFIYGQVIKQILYKCKNKGQTSCKKSEIADKYREEGESKTEGKGQKKNRVRYEHC